MGFINGLLPKNEHIGQALRVEHPLFPELAIRELVANALIHQDMTITGAGPQIEMFTDRIEITNPGAPLVNPDRMIRSSSALT
jgi:ATP-dependent DNA helicase RecG